MHILVLLKFTPLEFETRRFRRRRYKHSKLKFTPLEFETCIFTLLPKIIMLKFTPLEFETS